MFSRLPALTTLVLAAAAPAFAAEIIPLREWKFQKHDREPGGRVTDVTIPHTWNAEDSRNKDYYRGPAIYWRDLGPGEKFTGKRVFIRCEAVSSVAEIVLNGKLVGEHRGGFTEFGFELTPFLDAKGENTLEIRAGNSWRADILPLEMDFSIAGGAYRPVALVVCDTVCLNPVADGVRGVTMRYGKVSAEKASVTVNAAISNGGATAAPTKVRFTLLDKKTGEKVAETVREVRAEPGDTTVSAELVAERPHLWDGVRDPHLYVTEVAVGAAGRETDIRRLNTGFRDIRIDPEKGLFLNGRHLRLNGVNRHQDWENIGWALTPTHHRTDAEIIREMGADAVRGSHYPHAREFLDACDELGILVWSEISFANSVGFPSQHPKLEQNAVTELREAIRQQGSHPSIFTWSLFNELGMSKTADYLPLVRKLNAVAHEEDPTRPTTGATFHGKKELCEIPDIIAFNNYPGWYYGAPEEMEGFVQRYRKTCPGKAWGVSEYGAGASVKHHDPLVAKRVKAGGDFHPEEWQCRVHEGNYAAILRHDELWASFVWNMFDFATIGKNEGDRHGINDKGLVTRDRGIRKDAFYFYQANWSASPVLHLLSKRANPLRTTAFPVRVYSNLTDIRVTLDGKDLGAPKEYAPKSYATAPATLSPGPHTAVVTAKTASGETVSDTATWVCEPAAADTEKK